jgi:hypothetical protein
MLRSLILVSGMFLVLQGIRPVAGQDHKDSQPGDTSVPQFDESAPGEAYYCRVPEMPISWETKGQPVKIVHSDAVFTALGTNEPALDVLNTQTSAITNLAFVVEYLDRQGQKVTTAAIAAAAAGYETGARLPFPVECCTEPWKKPLEPGNTARVAEFYDSVRTLSCPQSARITFVIAKFKDGTVQQYAAEGWSVPPLPRLVPELTAACPVVKKNPTQIRAKLRISSTGEVTGISGPALTKDDPDLVAWVATQMKQWTFHPALLDGHPHDTDLDAEFVLYGDPQANLAAISLTSPATLISFYPREDSSRPRMY